MTTGNEGGMDSSAAGLNTSLKSGSVGVLAIVTIVLSSVAPLGAVIGGSPIVFGAAGVGAPAAYLLVGGLFLLFSVGYIAMSKHVVSAGGFVAIAAKGFGPRAGSMLGGVALLAYFSLIAGLWGFFSGISGFILEGTFGFAPEPLVSFVVLLALVTALIYYGVDLSVKILVVLLSLELFILIVLSGAILLQGGASGIEMQSFDLGNLFTPGIGIAFLFATTCFTGFEGTVVFSEEARDPEKTIPRAAYLSIIFIAVFYTTVTWALGIGYGAEAVQEAANNDPEGFVFALSPQYVGDWHMTAMNLLILTSLLAMFIGFHSIVSRYLFALARAGLLPAGLGKTNVADGNPQRAALTVSFVTLLIVGIFLIAGADPLAVIYQWFVALGTVSIQLVLIFASISMLAFFQREQVDQRIWHTRIAPGIAAIGFTTICTIAVINYDFLLAGQGGIARWMLVGIPLLAVTGWMIGSSRIAAGENLDLERIKG